LGVLTVLPAFILPVIRIQGCNFYDSEELIVESHSFSGCKLERFGD